MPSKQCIRIAYDGRICIVCLAFYMHNSFESMPSKWFLLSILYFNKRNKNKFFFLHFLFVFGIIIITVCSSIDLLMNYGSMTWSDALETTYVYPRLFSFLCYLLLFKRRNFYLFIFYAPSSGHRPFIVVKR